MAPGERLLETATPVRCRQLFRNPCEEPRNIARAIGHSKASEQSCRDRERIETLLANVRLAVHRSCRLSDHQQTNASEAKTTRMTQSGGGSSATVRPPVSSGEWFV
jgi:hypothetical protein